MNTNPMVRPLALATALLIAGPLSAMGGLVPPMVGFTMFGLGVLGAVVVGAIGAFLARRRGGPVLPFLAVAAIAFLMVVVPVLGSGGAPPINDITTDRADPPALDDTKAEGGLGLDMAFDPSFAPIIEEAYPDLEPLVLDGPVDAVVATARDCLEGLGGRAITDAGPGRLQATFRTRLFRFRDDLAVRVRDEGGKARVDVRSRSRDGKGDMGANAARISAVLQCMG